MRCFGTAGKNTRSLGILAAHKNQQLLCQRGLIWLRLEGRAYASCRMWTCSSPNLRLIPGGTGGKESPCQCRDTRDAGLIPEFGRSPGEGNGTPLQYSCLENPTDRGAWRATARGAAKRRTRLVTEHMWEMTHSQRISQKFNRDSPEMRDPKGHYKLSTHPCLTGRLLQPQGGLRVPSGKQNPWQNLENCLNLADHLAL